MFKLTNNEIEQIKSLENGAENKKNPLPRNAHSVFQFDINETIKDLKNDMENRNGTDFKVAKTSALKYEIIDPRFEYNIDGGIAYLTIGKGKMSVETAFSGFKYSITENSDGGSSVTFEGPVNALLNQNLLPKMTYVPKTLSAKFVDNETGKDLTEYMDIHSYGVLRAEKNKQADEWGEKENTQDKYGYHINAKFNNEIDFLPKSDRIEERTNPQIKQNIEVALHRVRDMIDSKSAKTIKSVSVKDTSQTNTVKKNTKELER